MESGAQWLLLRAGATRESLPAREAKVVDTGGMRARQRSTAQTAARIKMDRIPLVWGASGVIQEHRERGRGHQRPDSAPGTTKVCSGRRLRG